MLERELRQPVVDWLAAQGLEAVHEYYLGNATCDIVAFQFGPRPTRRIPPLVSVVAVELKIADISGVILQARRNRYQATASYAAMPLMTCRRMRIGTLRRFQAMGVGLLAVDVAGPVFEIISPVVAHDGREQPLKPNLWRRHRQDERRRKGNDHG